MLSKLLISFCFVFSIAQAQNASISTTNEAQASTSRVRLLTGLKSTNDSARFAIQNNSEARNLKAKQEMYLGARMDNGWGGYGQIVQTRTNFNDSSKNRWVSEDPSLTLLHPDFFNEGGASLAGQFRLYLPVSSGSKSLNRYQAAYYLTYKAKINGQDEVYNQLIPRAFYQKSYLAADRTFYVEDRATLSRKVNSWFRTGMGQWTQIEAHDRTETGATVDVYPYADFILSKNVYVGPRLFMPIYTKGSVVDGARSATADNALAEIYLEAKID